MPTFQSQEKESILQDQLVRSLLKGFIEELLPLPSYSTFKAFSFQLIKKKGGGFLSHPVFP